MTLINNAQYLAAKEGARKFRAEFLGRKARSNKTNAEGVIVGGYIDTGINNTFISGSFELRTASGIERDLLIDDLTFLNDAPQLPGSINE